MEINLSYEEIERLHDSGKMPDWWYYQVNGKSFEENYRTISRKRQEEMRELLEKRRLDAAVQAEIDKKLPAAVDKAITEIFKNLGK